MGGAGIRASPPGGCQIRAHGQRHAPLPGWGASMTTGRLDDRNLPRERWSPRGSPRSGARPRTARPRGRSSCRGASCGGGGRCTAPSLGVPGVRGLPVRAKAIQASCICVGSAPTGDPAGTRSRESGASSVPNTNGDLDHVARRPAARPRPGRLPGEQVGVGLRGVGGVQLGQPHGRHAVAAVAHHGDPEVRRRRALAPRGAGPPVHRDGLGRVELGACPRPGRSCGGRRGGPAGRRRSGASTSGSSGGRTATPPGSCPPGAGCRRRSRRRSAANGSAGIVRAVGDRAVGDPGGARGDARLHRRGAGRRAGRAAARPRAAPARRPRGSSPSPGWRRRASAAAWPIRSAGSPCGRGPGPGAWPASRRCCSPRPTGRRPSRSPGRPRRPRSPPGPS